jgi:ADP-dependent NAD(P)H-hydrate dehydratase / NAD(P)H-hydrate epimerase
MQTGEKMCSLGKGIAMTELLTAAQMRAIEQAAIASGEVTGLELMERAGRGVVEAIFEEWPELKATSHRAVVLCGPGNNGGDGFVVARLLKEWGWEVEVFLYGDPERMPPDARVNYERWLGMGEVRAWEIHAFISQRRVNLLLDAVFGIGITRPLPPEVIDAFAILRGNKHPMKGGYRLRYDRCVAIDLPSGIHTETGHMLDDREGHWLQAKLSVTFLMQKVGHHLSDGPFHCGKIVCKPLGLRREEFLERGPFQALEDDRRVELLDQRIYGKPAPFLRGRLAKFHGWHKYDSGHALILSGPSARGGAARLAARGALRIGAGVVTVGCPPDAIPENAARLDAVMLRGVADGLALEEALADPRINALCVGPGMGLDARGRELVAVALQSRGTPRPTVGRGVPRRSLVLDADALTILSQNHDLFVALHDECVLTPHAGEFAHLFPDIAAKLDAPATTGPAYSKVDATREAAARAGCVVLFKGPDTVIADPSGRCSINSAHYDRAAPWLATAGSGDVLAGFIAGLLARGLKPMQAAETAAWLHVECARSFGPGLIAEDLPEELPKVFRALGL